MTTRCGFKISTVTCEGGCCASAGGLDWSQAATAERAAMATTALRRHAGIRNVIGKRARRIRRRRRLTLHLAGDLSRAEGADVELLERFHRLLKPGGRLILLVPAFPWLYGSIDREVHHLRRYRRKDLVKKMSAAGPSIHQVHYFNLAGIPAWIWHGKILHLKIHREGDMRFWDQLVPWLQRFEKAIRVPAGLSLFTVAVKPEES